MSGKRLLDNKFGMILSVALTLSKFAHASEFRGLWVDSWGPGFYNAAEVRKLASDCRKYNFNAVMVEVRPRGDAFYMPKAPNPDPRTSLVAPGFDALAEIIKECHTGTPRIEVHAWLVAYYLWSADKPPPQTNHLFNLHPDYLTASSAGKSNLSGRYYLDPGNPEANLAIYNAAKDIVSRYDIDGLHWDYLRYPARDSGFNTTAIKRFTDEFGRRKAPSRNDPYFCDWRRRQITDFLRWVDADIWEIKPNLVISAAVYADIGDAYSVYFQDWPGWTKEGLLDVCIPMNFTPDTKKFFDPRVDQECRNQGVRSVYVGQGGFMGTKENTLAQLQYIRSSGLNGFTLFSYRNPNGQIGAPDETFAYIKEKSQPTWTETPAMPWKKTKSIVKGTVTEAKTGTPVYNAVVTLGAGAERIQKTGPNGKYAFFDLEPGNYEIKALGGRRYTTNLIHSIAGKVMSVDLTLRPFESLR